jgi:hypothetical protein
MDKSVHLDGKDVASGWKKAVHLDGINGGAIVCILVPFAELEGLPKKGLKAGLCPKPNGGPIGV